MLGVDVLSSFHPTHAGDPGLDQFIGQQQDWILGHFSYDFKHHLHSSSSRLPDRIGFPDAFLFVPRILFQLVGNTLAIGVVDEDANVIYAQVCAEPVEEAITQPVQVQSRLTPAEYLNAVQHLLDHIHRGDCYEINFCQEYFAQDVRLNTHQLYEQLASFSPNPFCAYYKLHQRHLVCASPERFLRKTGNRVIAQPIKGTGPRNPNDKSDTQNKALLMDSEKDKSENVMVVDLVRNDLSMICEKGSVTVDELFGVYPFPQVYQMISTVSGTLKPATTFAAILQAAFPMGSMTGAPKVKVIKLIEQYEKSKRGIYSGSVGYIAPNKDFDFNVVIRSIAYNAEEKYLSYHVGGGITSKSDPQKEYEECLLKAKAIYTVLNAGQATL